MRNKVSWLPVHLAINSRDDHVLIILLCCFDFSGRHIVPQVAVKSLCAQPVQKGRYLRIREGLKAYPDSPLFAPISVDSLRREAERRTSTSKIWGPTPEEKPGYGLKPLTELNWMVEYHLQLNPGKTQILVASPHVHVLNKISLGGVQLSNDKCISTTKNLGVQIDHHLTYHECYQESIFLVKLSSSLLLIAN